MARYLFSSHDGYGLGHIRRNTLIAAAVLEADPEAEVTLVTGVSKRPAWLRHPRLTVVEVPSLLKDSDGSYRNPGMAFEEAIARRAIRFDALVADLQPEVIVIDRHPYGIAGELRAGVNRARAHGAAVVLGLRDILDEPARINAEINGQGWADVDTLFTDLLVYGDPVLCDHEREYGVPLRPRYTGWVTESVEPLPLDQRMLVVAAGGGGDGEPTFRMGVELLRRRPDYCGALVAGPYATAWRADQELTSPGLFERLSIINDAPSCAPLFAGAGAVLQMAGYNSTFEALAAGSKPILMPRRSPRREQAIRSWRLAAFGLADVVDEGADAEEVVWLLDRPRRLDPMALTRVGIRLDGARRTASHLRSLAAERVA
ncbi:MAG: glycosyltransferase family protein [Acidimicrobiia bacterium]